MAILHSKVIGDGPVLVLLHGFLCSSVIWEKLIPTLKKNHKIVLIDLPGHGNSNNINVNTIDQIAELVINTITKLKINKCSVLGHSMGGYIALAMAYHKRNRIDRLILLNSTPFADSREKKLNRDRAIVAVQNTHQLFVRQFIPGLFSKENLDRCKKDIQVLQDEASKVSSEVIINGLKAMRDRKEYLNDLIEMGMNINIIIGKEDPVIDSGLLLESLQGKERINIDLIKNSGHMSFYEKPEICSELITGALC